MKSIKNWLINHSFPLLAFFIWRTILGLFAFFLAKNNFPLHPTFPYYLSELAHKYPRSLSTFAFFDGIHYLRIAEHGYVDTGTQAFFPLYPLIIRFFHNLTGLNYLNSALTLSASYMFLATLLIWHTFNKKTAKKIILLLLTFPTSFFFASVYTESLFLFFLSLWLYTLKNSDLINAREGGTLPSKGSVPSAIRSAHLDLTKLALISACASATRITGLALSLATTYLIWRAQNKVRNLMCTQSHERYVTYFGSAAKFVSSIIRNLFLTTLSFSGFIIYSLYLYFKFHDPLMFLHVQSMFGAHRSTHLIFPLQTLWRYLKIIITATPTTILYWRALFEFLVFIWGLYLLYKLYLLGKNHSQRYKLPATSYCIISLIMLSLSSFTGTLSSMPRYFVVILPLFYAWTKLYRSRLVFYLTLLLLASLQLVTFLLFATGNFIA